MANGPGEIPRVHPRQRVLKAARIVFNNNLSSFDVTLRDLTQDGARLKLQQAFTVPELFNLLILNPNTGRPETHPCRKAWQRGDLVGAHFEAGSLDASRQSVHIVQRGTAMEGSGND